MNGSFEISNLNKSTAQRKLVNSTAAAISFYDKSFRPRTGSMAARKRKLSKGVKEEKTEELKSPTSI